MWDAWSKRLLRDKLEKARMVKDAGLPEIPEKVEPVKVDPVLVQDRKLDVVNEEIKEACKDNVDYEVRRPD